MTKAAQAAKAATVVETAPKAQKRNIFESYAEKIHETAEIKATTIQSAKQSLAHAADVFSEGKSRETEANSIAGKAALGLYDLRVKGLASADEVSTVLGDVFGFKVKPDGKVSKTPEGRGEEIRKRIVRAFGAYEYVYNPKADVKYFANLPVEAMAEVEQVVIEIANGMTPLFTAYDDFAKIKKEYMEAGAHPAFDPAKVAKYTETLATPEAASIIRNSPALIAAYKGMLDVLAIIGTVEA